ncbi:hypothetical protein SDC9_109450 [bioreactor metagenome]|jgi:hypothetical protein|uniref:Uncharacterized protein n=1 Tax=bioreactor metagenome TaxID=1076179 RepID=A0A645BAU5_9ZZZZ
MCRISFEIDMFPESVFIPDLHGMIPELIGKYVNNVRTIGCLRNGRTTYRDAD